MTSHGSASESSTSRRGVTGRRPALSEVLASCGSMIEDRYMPLTQSVPSTATSGSFGSDNDSVIANPSYSTQRNDLDHQARANPRSRDQNGPSIDPYSQGGISWLRNNPARNPSLSGRYVPAPTFPSTSSATSATSATPPPTYHGSGYIPNSPRSSDDYDSQNLPDIYDDRKAEDYNEPAAMSSQSHLPGSINIVAPSDDGHSVDHRDIASHYQPVVQASPWTRSGSQPPSEALEATLETFHLATVRAHEERNLLDQSERQSRDIRADQGGTNTMEQRSRRNEEVPVLRLSQPLRRGSSHYALYAIHTHTSGYLPTFGYAPSFQSDQGDPRRFSIGSSAPEPRKSVYVKLLDSTVGAVIGPFLGRKKSSKNLKSSSARASPSTSTMPSPAPRDPAHGTRRTLTYPPAPGFPRAPSPAPVTGPSRGSTPTAQEPPQARVNRQGGASDQRHSQARTTCGPDDHRFWDLDPASPIHVFCSKCGMRRTLYVGNVSMLVACVP
ncbi:hypothetical protein BKA70DRAFT_1236476 [Coprinopsis sp. MPI-PUGE-AT-0042]|nr:hypothetical protein BKA70DRAFT_1236476 [Coprinopsis sp. MPI-PUGE-AT-0042]